MDMITLRSVTKATHLNPHRRSPLPGEIATHMPSRPLRRLSLSQAPIIECILQLASQQHAHRTHTRHSRPAAAMCGPLRHIPAGMCRPLRHTPARGVAHLVSRMWALTAHPAGGRRRSSGRTARSAAPGRMGISPACSGPRQRMHCLARRCSRRCWGSSSPSAQRRRT